MMTTVQIQNHMIVMSDHSLYFRIINSNCDNKRIGRRCFGSAHDKPDVKLGITTGRNLPFCITAFSQHGWIFINIIRPLTATWPKRHIIRAVTTGGHSRRNSPGSLWVFHSTSPVRASRQYT